MPLDSPHIVDTGFTSLTPEQASQYEQVKQQICDIVARDPDGLRNVLNAVLLTGDSALIMMHTLSELIVSEGWQSRDLVGIIHERPLGLPSLA